MSILYPSDISSLNKVIVHEPGNETQKVITASTGYNPAFVTDYLGKEAFAEHREYAHLLQQNGVQVLELVALLDIALIAARKEGFLHRWLIDTFPEIEIDKVEIDKITAKSIMGIEDEYFYRYEKGTNVFKPFFDPQKWIFFCRDFAAMTPKGIIICNFFNPERAKEPKIAQLIFKYSKPLQHIPIVFDALKEGFFIQGGDIMVKDSNTILVGIHNFTEKKAAKRMAQLLGLRIVAVALPDNIHFNKTAYDSYTPLNLLFLHLDSVLTFVDIDKFLVVPYWFENQYKDHDPLTDIILGLKPVSQQQHKVIELLRNVGWVTIFEPNTGNEIIPDTKIVDFLISEGYKPIYVGSDKPSDHHYKHVIECVLPELRFQAANVLALEPGKVLAYNDSPNTCRALVSQGVEVRQFSASSLVRWNGGPHCMALPLERA